MTNAVARRRRRRGHLGDASSPSRSQFAQPLALFAGWFVRGRDGPPRRFRQITIHRYLRGGWTAYVFATLVAFPVYVCDGGEMPVTRALLSMGVGPGPAFCFMLASVRTYLPTIAMATRIIGWRAHVIYVAAWFVLDVEGGIIHRSVALTGSIQSCMVSPMRTLLRLLICLAISCSLGLAAIAARGGLSQAKTGCCAQIEKDVEAKDCGQHSSKSNDDKQCCSMCVFCAAILATKTPFVYPPTGEESFATLLVREHVRSRPATRSAAARLIG